MIRKMELGDLEVVSSLALELGYRADVQELRDRFLLLSRSSDHSFFVSESNGDGIVGWIHAHTHQTLLTNARVEIAAIVVAENFRGKGVGKALIQEVEKWSREKSVQKLRLGSRIQRTDAHQFYQRLGFGIEKTWHIFTKEISK